MRAQLVRRADRLRARWGCGSEAPELPADRKAFAEAWGRAFRVQPPPSCPFAEVYAGDPLVGRVCEGLVLLEAGLAEESAFPGGVTAADRDAVGLVLGARSRCLSLEMPADKGGDDEH